MRIERYPRIEVPQAGWVPARGEVTLFTNSVASCIGLSIYDPSTQSGYLGHFDEATFEDPEFIEKITAATFQEIERPANSELWVGGSSILSIPSEANKEAQELSHIYNAERYRQRWRTLGAIGIFLEAGASLHTTWLKEEQMLSYYLDCSTGDHVIAIKPTEPIQNTNIY